MRIAFYVSSIRESIGPSLRRLDISLRILHGGGRRGSMDMEPRSSHCRCRWQKISPFMFLCLFYPRGLLFPMITVGLRMLFCFKSNFMMPCVSLCASYPNTRAVFRLLVGLAGKGLHSRRFRGVFASVSSFCAATAFVFTRHGHVSRPPQGQVAQVERAHGGGVLGHRGQ